MRHGEAEGRAAMTRGGRRTRPDDPERRCIATAESGPTARLVRFVLGPDDLVTPDLAGRLPGRGAWLTADRALVEKAVAKRLFARAFRTPVRVPDGLADLLEAGLAERTVQMIAMARKAGQAVTGFEKTRGTLEGGGAGLLLEAADGAEGGRAKLRRMAAGVTVVDSLTARELGLAFGRDFAIHAALQAGTIADRVQEEAGRLAGLRAFMGSAPAAGDGCHAGNGPGASGTKREAGPKGGPEREFG